MSGCRKIGDLLGAYIYGDLTAEEMRRVRLHADGCAPCGRELESRTRAMALVPDSLPKLSDEEKQQVMWTVKGAIRAKSERRGFRVILPVLVKSGAMAAVLAGAFAAGVAYQTHFRPAEQVVRYVPVHQKRAPKQPEPDQMALDLGAAAIANLSVDPGLLQSYDQSIRDLIDPPYRGLEVRPGEQPVPDESAAPEGEASKLWDWPDGMKREDPSSSLWESPKSSDSGNSAGGIQP